jgi:hypothetical protein
MALQHVIAQAKNDNVPCYVFAARYSTSFHSIVHNQPSCCDFACKRAIVRKTGTNNTTTKTNKQLQRDHSEERTTRPFAVTSKTKKLYFFFQLPFRN